MTSDGAHEMDYNWQIENRMLRVSGSVVKTLLHVRVHENLIINYFLSSRMCKLRQHFLESLVFYLLPLVLG